MKTNANFQEGRGDTRARESLVRETHISSLDTRCRKYFRTTWRDENSCENRCSIPLNRAER